MFDAISDLSAILGIAFSYIVLSVLHTLQSRLFNFVIYRFVLYVFKFKLWSLVPIIHAGIFLDMADTKEWLSATWTVMTRDAPPPGLPGPEIANVITRGVLLCSCITEGIIFQNTGIIVNFIYRNMLLLSSLLVVLLLPLVIAIVLALLGSMNLVDPQRYVNGIIRRLKVLMGLVGTVGAYGYHAFSDVLEFIRNIQGKIWTALRPFLEAYSLKQPKLLYMYEKLANPERNIRLVRLQKRNPLAEMNCSLIEHPLAEAPAYEAISYTWGSGPKDHLVFLDGRWLPTSQKVRQILEGRASYWTERWLWIDSLCIDQTNSQEKNSQVRIMGDIYQTADRVVVWLEDSNLSPSKVTLAMFLLENIKFVVTRYQEYGPMLDPISMLVGTKAMWEALSELVSHPYWQRVWILQEIAKAKKVHLRCGERYTDWNSFWPMVFLLSQDPANEIVARNCLLLNASNEGLARGVMQIVVIASLQQTSNEAGLLDIKDCLARTNRCAATDPRDKIFALHSMAKWHSKQDKILEPLPDYSASVELVYIRTAQYLLSTDPGFVLCHSGIGSPRQFDLEDMPSWVPDWTSISPCIRERDVPVGQRYQACGSTTQSISTAEPVSTTQFISFASSEKPQLLPTISMQAIPVAAIKELSAFSYATVLVMTKESKDGVCNFLKSAQALLAPLPERYAHTGQPVSEAFWRTLIGDRCRIKGENPPAYASPAPPECAAFFTIFRDGFFGVSSETAGFSSEEAAARTNASFIYSRALANACGNQRFAVMENGLIALVPSMAQVGDTLVVALGMEKPFLMRKAAMVNTGKGEIWRYVGDCYAHGIMKGKVVASHMEEMTTFVVC
jgi:hypothetical protein